MHPLTEFFGWFPNYDFGIMNHGFLPHGRDYQFLLESAFGKDPGRYLVQFTHVPELSYLTNVTDDVWPRSWGDELVDYKTWLDSGEPDGYMWGTCWSLAWPGARAVEPSAKAANWAERLGKDMHEFEVKTDRFCVNLIFHSLRWKKISEDTSVVSRGMTILGPDS